MPDQYHEDIRRALREQQLDSKRFEILGKIRHADIPLLLEDPDPQVACAAAIALGAGAADITQWRQRFAGLPPPVLARWREIVVNSPPEDRWDRSLARILGSDRDLCIEWLRAWFGRLREHRPEAYVLGPGIEVRKVIGELPADVRAKLIADLPAGAPSGAPGDAVQSLVSGDIAVAKALFGRPDIEHLHRYALAGGHEDIGEAWMDLALLAMDHGWEPERIAAAVLRYGYSGWNGDESEHWRRYVEAFRRLLPAPEQPDAERRKRIADAGMARFGKLRDGAP